MMHAQMAFKKLKEQCEPYLSKIAEGHGIDYDEKDKLKEILEMAHYIKEVYGDEKHTDSRTGYFGA